MTKMSEINLEAGAILYLQTNPDEAVIQIFGDYYYMESQKKPVGLGRSKEKAKDKLKQLNKNYIVDKVEW